MLRSAAARRPERMWQFRDDSFAELVPGIGEAEGDVGVEALEPERVARAADPERERSAAVRAGSSGGKLLPERALPLCRLLHALPDAGVVCGAPAPLLDASCRLESRNRRDQVRAGHVVGRREGLALAVVRILLGDGRPAEGAADDY